MKISERAAAHIGEVPEKDRPLSEEFRLTAREYADADAAASLLEELKSTTLEKRKSIIIAEQPGLAENKAERFAKTSIEWESYIRQMCASRAQATRLRLKLEWIRMRHREWVGADANARHEAKL